MLFSQQELLQATGGKHFGPAFEGVTGVSSDTRTLNPGNAFVALEGSHFDGHAYINMAFEAGATVCIVSDAWAHAHKNELSEHPIVTVHDTLRALGALAKAHRMRFHIPVIGVTGSNGKTTTKEMLASILSLTGPGLKTEGNLNNLIGLPHMVLKLEEEMHWAVFEMGMSESGEIDRLADIAIPDTGIILNAFPAHLASMGTVEAVAKAKGELLFKIADRGLAVINADDSRIASLPQNPSARRVSFGINRGEVRAEHITGDGINGQRFVLVTPKGSIPITLKALGAHAIYDALAASAALLDWVPLETIREGLGNFQPYSGRFHIETLSQEMVLIDDSYNANPASMKAALSTVQEVKDNHPAHIILGDMLELGTDEQPLHQQLGARAAHVADHLYLLGSFADDIRTGARSAGLAEEAISVAKTHQELFSQLQANLTPGSILLIKGSRGMKMDAIAAMVRTAYERED